MDNLETIAALAALAQSTRPDAFRLFVSHEPDGVPAGELARLIEVPQNTMSAHLAILAHAGLVKGDRQSRSIIYRANLARFREVALFLLKDCCGGRADICAPIIADLTPCSRPMTGIRLHATVRGVHASVRRSNQPKIIPAV
jgi:ArsR family transcriptional regulator